MLTAQPCPRQIHTICTNTCKICIYTQNQHLHPKSSLPYENTRLNHREGMKFSMFARNLMGTTDLGGLVPYCTAWPGLVFRVLLTV